MRDEDQDKMLENQLPEDAEVIGPPTEDDLFFLEWGKETLKKNISTVNDILQRMVTLNCALLGGTIAFYDEKIMPTAAKFWVELFFLAALVPAFLGMLPKEERVDLKCPSDIKAAKKHILDSKVILLWFSGIATLVAFCICLVVILGKIFNVVH